MGGYEVDRYMLVVHHMHEEQHVLARSVNVGYRTLE